MSHLRRAQIFVGLVAGGAIGPGEPGLHARLAMAGALYGHDPFVSRSLSVARLVVEEAEDRAFLERIVDGTGDVLSEETFPRREPRFAKYPEGSNMFALLEKAAEVFGDAVQEIAARAIASCAIDDARRRAFGNFDE